MKILSLDTSSKNAIVVITEDEEKIIELNNEEEKTHSQKLMPMIDEAFQKSHLSLNDIDLIVCCIGPGSFTGVRIGIATAKAFADSKDIPVVGVNSLEVLAYSLEEEGKICALIDAGHGNAYVGYYEIGKDEKNKLRTIQEELAFLNLTDEKLKEIQKQYKIANEQNVGLGITIAKIGYTKYKNGKSGSSSILSPVYLRKSQAELALEEKTK
ncbi:MAG: tRNA (adenosine(37)-N6)-threonylcarbamoyltransferase complex dimerization subunit type 1 TsaB [Clostridia bacterium]|nr:tRNA (adenosine(37)-N6)-threonylcarbamoyltransferase complex dimerization subunit type 1 TsaB [Clostridia bacterium]MCI9413438.1 tRNA (adenosine(37)-N6)-threonylcarbamoyltransferase complex dimerization subunit type 1 TsaB [Clostridia bacterium]